MTDIQECEFQVRNSYISKEEFISLITNINFVCVKECDLELITGFIANADTNEVKPLCKNIRID